MQVLNDKVAWIFQELENIKNMIKNLPNSGQEFDVNILWALEEKLLEKLDMVATALQQTLANKAETKKALKHLEKMIKNLYEYLFA